MARKFASVSFKPKNITKPSGKEKKMKYKKPKGVSDKYYKENRK